MDILRVLSTPDLEVRKKTLQLALDLVSSRNVEEVSSIRSISTSLFHVKGWKLNKKYCKYTNACLFSSW